MTYSGEHFERWVAYFETLPGSERVRLAALYGASRATARELATYLCDHHEQVVQVVDEALGDTEARLLMQEIVLDHDLEVPLMPSPLSARKTLAKLGIIPDARATHAEVSGAWAAVLAPLLSGTRTSVMTLLGNVDDALLQRMVKAWGGQPGPYIANVLFVADRLGREETLNEIVERLPDLDYMGAAMVAIELGGVCFWQEVFGYDLEPTRDAKVVPFMRRDERAMEKDIAETLMELGVIFRVDEHEAPMLVVPEELWQPVWDLGRSWLLDWVADTFDATSLASQRRDEPARGDLQATFKFLVLEADGGHLTWNVDALDEAAFTRLAQVGGQSPAFWEEVVELGLQLGVFRPDGVNLQPNGAQESLLDLPRQAFGRQVMFAWCMGTLGKAAEQHLAKAMGLDDVWRRQMLKVLRRADETTPLWLLFEGVEPMMTGAGCLRDIEDSPDDLLIGEYGIANALIWTTKLLWLDLLSMLPGDYWYSKRALAELLQILAAFSTFSHILQVLEHPDVGFYVPVQRASFMTDPMHTPEFETWVDQVVRHLMEPLGVAARSADGDFVWLDTGALRVPSPPGLLDEHRETLVRDIFGDAGVSFKVPGAAPMRLHRVPSDVADSEIGLDAPLQALRAWLGERTLTRFDGQHVWVD